MNTYYHFKIPIFNWSKREFLNELSNNIKSWKQNYSTTPNPEIILKQSRDKKLRNILLKSRWNLTDWFWLLIWSYLEKEKPKNLISFFYKILTFKKNKSPIKNRICWSDIFLDICKLSEINSFKIFLIWWKKWVSEKVKNILITKFPNIKIVWISVWYKFANSKETLEKIKKTKPNIIFLALWVPYQEYWINDNIKKLPFVNFLIWVWWTFDFICNIQKRAPIFLRKIWLEWLWRLIIEPRRIKRIFNAIFWYLYFVYKNIDK